MFLIWDFDVKRFKCSSRREDCQAKTYCCPCTPRGPNSTSSSIAATQQVTVAQKNSEASVDTYRTVGSLIDIGHQEAKMSIICYFLFWSTSQQTPVSEDSTALFGPPLETAFGEQKTEGKPSYCHAFSFVLFYNISMTVAVPIDVPIADFLPVFSLRLPFIHFSDSIV